MLSQSMHEALNKQLTAEFASGYLYLSMAAYCDARGWKGMAAWMRMHAGEEAGHAMRFYRYLTDQGAEVLLGALKAPPPSSGGPEDIVARALEHEQEVTRSIGDLKARAEKQQDRESLDCLSWFVREQGEEERVFQDMLEQARAAVRDGRFPALDDTLGDKARQAAPQPLA